MHLTKRALSDRRCAARACGDVRRALAGEAAGDGMARAEGRCVVARGVCALGEPEASE
jgi:hypothetical protein